MTEGDKRVTQNPMKYVGALSLLALLSLNAVADDYTEARAELIAAYELQNYPAMIIAAEKSLVARPEYPGALFNLAFAQALAGEPEDSLKTLERLLAKGIDYNADNLDEFAAVRELPGWRSYISGIEKLYEPIGEASVALQLDDGQFIPEGIALDVEGNFYLGSIRKGQLIRANGTVELLSDRAGHWSVFGMRFDDNGDLWFASAAVAQLVEARGDTGKSGLFQFDIETGDVTREVILPQDADDQVLGDLVIEGDAIYTTDSLTGALYRYRIETDKLETLQEPGTFGSPQGLVSDESGDYLYVADYIGGLYRVSVSDGSRERLLVPVQISDHGIDGLYRYGSELIAIQNGIRPHRVVAFQLSDNGLAVEGVRPLVANHELFDEPTLGVVRGDELFFVANSHWNRFDANNALPEDLAGPVILKVSLASQE
jgi:tetratricopeptide (TPR) repeat protein